MQEKMHRIQSRHGDSILSPYIDYFSFFFEKATILPKTIGFPPMHTIMALALKISDIAG